MIELTHSNNHYKNVKQKKANENYYLQVTEKAKTKCNSRAKICEESQIAKSSTIPFLRLWKKKIKSLL